MGLLHWNGSWALTFAFLFMWMGVLAWNQIQGTLQFNANQLNEKPGPYRVCRVVYAIWAWLFIQVVCIKLYFSTSQYLLLVYNLLVCHNLIASLSNISPTIRAQFTGS